MVMNDGFKFNLDDAPDKVKGLNPDIKPYNSKADIRHVTFVLLNGEYYTFYYFELTKVV